MTIIIYKTLKFIICITAGVTMYIWLSNGTYDEYSLGGRARILYTLINIIGWNGLFILVGFITFTTFFGIFSIFDGDEYGIWDEPGEK